MAKVFSYLTAAFLYTFLFSLTASSQTIPFDSDRWEIRAKESKVMEYLGRNSLYMQEGIATVKDSQFTDGIVEFDFAVSETPGFMGAVWRLQDYKNYEEFYIRPHHSTHPDANQYEPVFNGIEAWQLYTGEGYSGPVKYDFNEWMHVKIVVSGRNAEIYIKDMENPVLFVNELKRETKAGKVGLRVKLAPAYYSNFSFVAMNHPPLKKTAKAPEITPPGTVTSWLISNAITGKSLEQKYQLTQADKQKLTWKPLDSESTGITNLARLQGIDGETNTAFARVIIQSDREQVKKIRFGFSDAVKVYFNDRLIYSGSDGFQSRDSHFLGTIGLFDELYLPLKKGDNELWLAITETFGGWGVKALFEDISGIKIKEVRP